MKMSFVFEQPLDPLLIRSILFVHSSVSQLQQDTNKATLGIGYDYDSLTDELLEFSPFSNVDRIGFAFHYSGNSSSFMNGELLFTESDLEETAEFSKNVQFLLSLIRKCNVSRVDFLACNTLLDDKWKVFYQILQEQTGVIVGASDNNTGNLKYGGDWIMESTQEDVSLIYFSSAIVNFASLLGVYTDPAYASMTYTTVVPSSGTTSTASLTVTSVKTSVPASYTVFQTFVTDGVTYTVTSIDANAFLSCTTLTRISIPDGITSIGSSAFKNCSNLTTVTLPTTRLKTINANAFENCIRLSMTDLPLPTGLLTIGASAFYLCKLIIGKVTIPGTVTTLGTRAFEGTNLSSVIFTEPAANSIATGNFLFRVTGIRYIDLSKTKYTSIPAQFAHGAFDPNVTNARQGTRTIILPYSVTSMIQDAFNSFQDDFELLVLPSVLLLTPTTPYFYYGSATGVAATYYCKKLIMYTSSNAGVTKQYYQYVGFMPTMSSVATNPSNNEVFNNIINNFKMTTVRENTNTWTPIANPVSVTANISRVSIGNQFIVTFTTVVSQTVSYTITNVLNGDLNTDIFSGTVTTGTQITYTVQTSEIKTIIITVDNDISTSIFLNPDYIFENLKYTYTIGSGVASVSRNNTTLTVANILNSFTANSLTYNVTTVDNQAFIECTLLTSVILPINITIIGTQAFQNCTSLTRVIIPNNVTSIGFQAFQGCTNLIWIAISNSVANIGTDSFLNTGTHFSLIRSQLTNSICYEYIGDIADRSGSKMSDYFNSWSLSSSFWRPLKDTITVDRIFLYQDQSLIVTFIVNQDQFPIFGRTTLTYSITGVNSADLSNVSSLSGTVQTGTSITYTVTTSILKTLVITVADGASVSVILNPAKTKSAGTIRTAFSRF